VTPFESPWATVWRCLCDPIRLAVSVEHRHVTDRQTDRHTTAAYSALAWRRAVKIGQYIFPKLEAKYSGTLFPDTDTDKIQILIDSFAA